MTNDELLALLSDLPRPKTAADCLADAGIDQLEQPEAAAAYLKKTAAERHQSRVAVAREAMQRVAQALEMNDDVQEEPADTDPATSVLLAVVATTGEGAHLPDWCSGWAGKARRVASDGPAWQASIREAGLALLAEVNKGERYFVRPTLDEQGLPWLDLVAQDGTESGFLPLEKWVIDLPAARAFAARGLGVGAPLWENVDAEKNPAGWGPWLAAVEKMHG